MFGRGFGITDQETLVMLEDVVGRARLAVVDTLNVMAERVKDRSLEEVPKSGAHEPTEKVPLALEETSFVDPATPEELTAVVGYDHPAAAAQEVGEMIYKSRSGKEVLWVVERYTTAGTKSRYLEDALKSTMATAGEELGIQGHLAFSTGSEWKVPRA